MKHNNNFLTSGVAVDNYKLPVFRKNLDEADFTTRVEVPQYKGVTLIKVIHDPDRIDELAKVISKSDIDAKRSN